jgi:hypothetical protein
MRLFQQPILRSTLGAEAFAALLRQADECTALAQGLPALPPPPQTLQALPPRQPEQQPEELEQQQEQQREQRQEQPGPPAGSDAGMLPR